jgi:DNA-binding winged helix-turn-helix (wHTH) protein/tetratricopeptide (TPR) repeat protein
MLYSDKPSYRFGPFLLNSGERMLLRQNEPVTVPPKVFDTLLALVENAGRLLGKDELMNRLWPDTFVQEATLARNISDLRRILANHSGDDSYIETVPKSGYRFVASVEVLNEGLPELVVQRHKTSRVLVEEEIESHSASKSIAVLPFKELSGEIDDEYLGLGMADALITRLGNISQVSVRPTSAVAKYASRNRGPIVAGHELSVEAVVDGSIQRSGGNIRVTVQLVSVAAETVIWAAVFDEKLSDIFAIEDSISNQIIDSLTLKLTGAERTVLSRRYTTNPAAYQEYLKGRYYLNKRMTRWLRKAVEHFQKAIDLDREYAAAHAGLADSCTLLVTWEAMPPQDGFAKARAAASRALELDDSQPAAYASLGHILLHTWEWAESESSFKRAIKLNASYSPAHQWYAEYLAAMGRFDEAIAEALSAHDIDPLSLVHSADVGFMLYYARRYDEAIDRLLNTVEMDPDFWIPHHLLGQAYTQKEMHEQALAEAIEAARLCGKGPLSVLLLGHAYAAAGKRSEAWGVLDKLKELAKHRYFSPYRVATIHAGLGNADRVFEYLERAYAGRDARLIWLKVDPVMDKLRSDPRYADLLRRIRLTEN